MGMAIGTLFSGASMAADAEYFVTASGVMASGYGMIDTFVDGDFTGLEKDKTGGSLGGGVVFKNSMLALDYVNAGMNERFEVTASHKFEIDRNSDFVVKASYFDPKDDVVKEGVDYGFTVGAGASFNTKEDINFSLGAEHVVLEYANGISGVDDSETGFYGSVSVPLSEQVSLHVAHRSVFKETSIGVTYLF